MLLEVEELAVRYREGRLAIDGVSFTIGEGQTLGLVGPSGSGKSTIARAIMGSLPAGAIVRGSIRFRGEELIGKAQADLRKLWGAQIAMVWQEPSAALNPVMTVGTQVEEVLRAHFAWPREQRRRAVEAAMAQVGLGGDGVKGAYPHQLSGGQLQRVVIAQALVCRPALVLADEPASSLDSVTQASILELLATLRRDHGLSLLFITHNEALLRGLADSVVRLA